MLLFQFLLLSGFNHKHYITELEIITMRLYPAIDIKDGQCVRLKKGLFNEVTVYSDKPYEIAKAFEESGAQFIHTVDLDGALKGHGVNADTIKKIVSEPSLIIDDCTIRWLLIRPSQRDPYNFEIISPFENRPNILSLEQIPGIEHFCKTGRQIHLWKKILQCHQYHFSNCCIRHRCGYFCPYPCLVRIQWI